MAYFTDVKVKPFSFISTGAPNRSCLTLYLSRKLKTQQIEQWDNNQNVSQSFKLLCGNELHHSEIFRVPNTILAVVLLNNFKFGNMI